MTCSSSFEFQFMAVCVYCIFMKVIKMFSIEFIRNKLEGESKIYAGILQTFDLNGNN